MYQQEHTPFYQILLAAQQAKANQQAARAKDLQAKILEGKLDLERERFRLKEAERLEKEEKKRKILQLRAMASGVAQNLPVQNTPIPAAQSRPVSQMAPGVDTNTPARSMPGANTPVKQATQDDEKNKKIFQLRALAAQDDSDTPRRVGIVGQHGQAIALTPNQAREQLAQIAPDDPWLKAYNERQKRANDVAFKGIGSEWLNAANQVVGPLTPSKLAELASPEGEAQRREISDYLARAQASRGTRINVGTGQQGQQIDPLTMGRRAQVQEKIEATRDSLFQVAQLRSLGNPKRFLGLKSRLRNWGLGIEAQIFPEDLSEEENKLLQDARRFKEINEQIFNNYRVMVTGAGASMKELASLQNSIVNKNLSDPEYRAALDRFEDFARRAEATYARLLRQGIDVADPGYGKMFDRMMYESAGKYTEKKTESEQQLPDLSNASDEQLRAIVGGQ
jgi:hypothetical protein